MGFLRPKSISRVECHFQNFKNLIFFRSSPGTPYKVFLPIFTIRAPAWATFTFLVFHAPFIFIRVLDASWKLESVYAFKKIRSAFAPKDKTNEVCVNLYCNPLYTIVKRMGKFSTCTYGSWSRGGYSVRPYSDIPSPNTTVFGLLWPSSSATWGSLLLLYNMLVR